MKKQLLILFVTASLVLTGCGGSASKKATKNALLSKGVKNISQKVVNDYNHYISADISKNDLISNVDGYEEQANDIEDEEKHDYEAIRYIHEFNKMLNNNIAGKKDYELPINDLKTLLSGKEVEKIDTTWVSHSLDDIYFELPKEYELVSDEDGIQTYSYDGMLIQVLVQDKLYDVFTTDTFKDYINIVNDSTFDLSTEMDCYFSRGCNFFYSTSGSCKFNDDLVHTDVYICLDGSKMVSFYFYSISNTAVKKQILNDAII